MSNVIKVENLSRSFGSLDAVDGVSFEVDEKETVGIIGPNGSGKTTIFNLITGALSVDEGKIFLRNEDVTDLSRWERVRKGVIRMFQTPQLFEELSVRENISVPGRENKIRGSLSHAWGLYEELEDILGEEVMEKETKNLSLIETRLVELYQKISSSPDILLADEVFAGLTEDQSDVVRDNLESLRKSEGLSIVIIDHSLGEVKKSCDRVLVLNKGSFIAEGSYEECINDEAVRNAYLKG